MISSTDFIHIPYTPDMTKAGVAYTCHWLIHQNNSLNTPFYPYLRSIVAGKAVELSFRRYLVEHQIPHQNLSSTKFSDPDRYDITLRGRRCELYSILLSQKKVIRQAHSNPDELLIAQVSLPSELVASELLSEHDLYVFSFVTALVTGNRRQLRLALAADQPVFPIYLLPKTWSRPTPWVSLGKLTLKSENNQPLKLVLGGQVANMQLNMEELELSPGLRAQVCSDFYSLSYMEVSPVPTGRVGVHSPWIKKTIIIQPNNWRNIWIYGMEIILCGYITHAEFRQRAREFPAGSYMRQNHPILEKSLALQVAELHPLEKLFEMVKVGERS